MTPLDMYHELCGRRVIFTEGAPLEKYAKKNQRSVVEVHMPIQLNSNSVILLLLHNSIISILITHATFLYQKERIV